MFQFHDLVKPEVNYIVDNGNFTDQENEVFMLRCKGESLENIAESCHVCYKTAYRINKRIKNKIWRIL